MRKKISVIGEGVRIAHDLARYADVGEDLRGTDVVVLAGDGDLTAIARSAPAAVVIVAGPASVRERCREVSDATLFPRARIVGIEDRERVADAVESIVFERDDDFEVVALSDGEFEPLVARLGRGGIRGPVRA